MIRARNDAIVHSRQNDMVSGPPEVDDQRPTRVRRPGDLVRLVLALAAVAVLLTAAPEVAEAASQVGQALNRLIGVPPEPIRVAFISLGLVSSVAVPVGLVIGEIVSGRRRRALEGMLTGLGCLALVETANVAMTRFGSHLIPELTARTDGGRPLDSFLATVFASSAALGVTGGARWRVLVRVSLAWYALSVLLGGLVPAVSALASIGIGVLVGVAVRFGAGQPNTQPDGWQLAAALHQNGISLKRLRRDAAQGEGHRNYLGLTEQNDHVLMEVFDRDQMTTGAFNSAYRLLRFRRDVLPPPPSSLEGLVERRATLALAAQDAGMPSPRLLAAIPCGRDCMVLAYATPPVHDLKDPSDEQLTDLWQMLERLHRRRVTYGGLSPGRVRADPDGNVRLGVLGGGTLFASDLRIRLDRAQALMSCALVVGPDRAVDTAVASVGNGLITATLPLIQPLAMPSETRNALRRRPETLELLRQRVQAGAGSPASQHPITEPAVRVERFRPRSVFALVAMLVAGYFAVTQLGGVNLISLLGNTRLQWIPVVIAASAATFAAAALCLVGAVNVPIPFPRTMLVQVSTALVRLVTPPAVGGMALNIRYLRQHGLTTVESATSVATTQVVNALSHVVLLGLITALTASSSPEQRSLPGWAFVALAALVALLFALSALKVIRRLYATRIRPALHEAFPVLHSLATRPRKLAEATLGSISLNAGYVVALWASAHALGADLGLAQAAVVYLAGAAVGSVVPTPGGLGALELAFSTGLTATGMPGAVAVSSVLIYRLFTFWLPLPLGWWAFRHLDRRGVI